MAHTFLIEPGQWIIEGSWVERNQMPILVKGRTIVAWNQEDWFNMVTKLEFPESDRDDFLLKYRGRIGSYERQYTFVLQHSKFGNVEGEGMIAPESIIQRYWVLGDERQRRSGFETLRCLDNDHYHYSSGMMGASSNLLSIMEAKLERRS